MKIRIIPDLTSSDDLKEYHRFAYINLLTTGRLNDYLADIDGQAQGRFVTLTEQAKQTAGRH